MITLKRLGGGAETRRTGWIRNPTQAKRRLEWATHFLPGEEREVMPLSHSPQRVNAV
jgi:hypothetical protein